MSLIVMKFGGTSVVDEKSRNLAINKIIDNVKAKHKVAVIISAMGRNGQPYATDTLLSLINEDANIKDRDLLLSCGEVISAVVMSDMLNNMGYNAQAITGFQAGIVTDSVFGAAKCKYVNPDYLKELLDSNIIPIITGFQGINEKFEITTLGRGGSDTSAIIIGAALKADSVEIYTDVDGIMTTDPRIVKNAQYINVINTDELFQMAAEGANVIHPKAVEIAIDHKIDMKVKNTFSEKEGTTIINKQLMHDPKNMNDVVSSIVLLKDRVQVKITKVQKSQEHQLLKILAENNISLDLINIFTESFIFTINKHDVKKCRRILEEEQLTFEIIEGLSKVTAIGAKMHGVPGVMAKIVTALTVNECEILQSADSYTNISCLIKEEDGEKAVKALHEEFIEANIGYEMS